MAASLIGARLVVAGYAFTTAAALTGVLGPLIGAAGAGSAIGVWLATLGGLGIAAAAVLNASSNMTLHDALTIEGQAATLQQDEINNGCITLSPTGGSPMVVDYTMTPGGAGY